MPVCSIPELGYPDSKVHETNMGPTQVLSAPDGPHVGPMNLAIRVYDEEVRIYIMIFTETLLNDNGHFGFLGFSFNHLTTASCPLL